MGYWETVHALNTLRLGHQVLVGDILPTFVGPEAVRARIDETNARYSSLDDAYKKSSASADLHATWDRLNQAWDGFVRDNRDSFWSLALNAKALSEELDRYDENYKAMYDALARELAAQGQAAPAAVAPPSSNPHAPGSQGTASAAAASLASSPIVVVAMGLLGLFAAGYLIKAVKA